MPAVHVVMKDEPKTGAAIIGRYADVLARRRAVAAPPEKPKPEPLAPAVIFLQADEWFPTTAKPVPTVAAIINVVSWHYEISRVALLSGSQRARLALPRQVAMFLVRRIWKRSFPEIGRIFNRDHSTIVHAVSKIERLSIDDPTVRADLAAIEKALAG